MTISMDTVVGIAESIRRGERRAVDVLRESLDAIARDNPRLNAIVHIDPELARRSAEAIDAAVAGGRDPGPLAGVPFAVKDLDDCAGMPTSHGSLIYQGGPPCKEDSPLVARLRGAGAVPVGKSAASEFGMDSATSTRAWGVTRNPWNPALTPGGSSGGSASAVAAGMLPFATGGDGGGSIRSPAAFTNLVGLKTTHGRIARSKGSSDFAVSGVLTTTVRDTARLLDMACGPNLQDKMSIPEPGLGYESVIESLNVAGLRALWTPDLGYAPVEPEVVRVARESAQRLAQAAKLRFSDERIVFSNSSEIWLKLACAELRWGLELDGVWPARAKELCDITRFAAKLGERVTAKDFIAATRAREQLEGEVADFFTRYDVMLTPTVACAAFAAEGPIPSMIDGRDASVTGAEPFTMLANMAWIPAISVPAGFTRDGLPVGLQIMAPRFRDDIVLRLARIVEQTNPWPRLAPARA